MRAGQLSLDEQMTCLREALDRNRTLGEVLGGAAVMNLPGWYLVAGCLYQTVWNVITGQPPEAGILDYDLVYFDESDLSWEAEDAVIRAGDEVFAGLAAPVEIRNQARVHLWYEQKFGFPCQPHASSEAAIDTYEATVACLGVRLEPGGRRRRQWIRGAPDQPGGGGRGQIQHRPREREDHPRRREGRALELAVLRPGAAPRLALRRPGGQPLRRSVNPDRADPGPGLPKPPAAAGRAPIIV